MTYYNPVFCFPGGEGEFVRAAKAAGVDGLILPDLPPDEGAELIAAARTADLDTVFLVAPTSTPERLALVTAACRGFVYAVSVTGVTGARDSVPAEVAGLVAAVKAVTDLPVAVGFGVGSAASARRVAAVADGVVVGSALVSTLERGEALGPAGRGTSGWLQAGLTLEWRAAALAARAPPSRGVGVASVAADLGL